MDAKRMLIKMLEDLPDGASSTAKDLLHEVIYEAMVDKIQLIWGTPIGRWINLLQEYDISSVDDLRVKLERAEENV